MTTEETLRKALADLVADYDGVEDMLPPDCLDKILAARAALAIPPTEERIEYRVAWEWCGLCEEQVDSYAEAVSLQAAITAPRGRYKNVRIESRTAAGEWAAKS